MNQNDNYKIVFLSNFMNHHQLTLSKELYDLTDKKYLFVATTPVPKERLTLGYHDMNSAHDFILRAYESEESYNLAKKHITDADIVIYGGVSRELIKNRLRKNKLTLKYFERIYKTEPKWYKMPYNLIKDFLGNTVHKNYYLLCAGAYVADDYARTRTFLDKAYKWGYFPEVKEYENIDTLIDGKKKNSLLWAGRLIDWKHPEIPLGVAKKLKADGYDFELNIIGSGALDYSCRYSIERLGLNDNVHMLGSMSPEAVREYMENSEIFLFTSDRQEGWGAVLNESMNSACAVVADKNIGAVPYLLKDGENGYLYESEIDEIYERVKFLLDNPDKRKEMGKNAYFTMKNEWNPKVAAQRLLILAEELKNNKKCTLYENGPCSVAEVHKRKK